MISRRSMLASLAALGGCTSGPLHAADQVANDSGPLRNTLVLRDASGSGARNHPVRIGRPFIAGEIKSAPQAVVQGVRLDTQADIKTRWSDGSVQHAILSFVVPVISSNGSVTVSFEDQPIHDIAPMTVAEMLDTAFDFDALLQITQGDTTHTASARAMLEAGDFVEWCHGSVATTVLIADHSAARKYDMGFDELRSIRPIFLVTFWHALHKVHVRVIGENANTETLEDVQYTLALRAGHAKSAEVFRQEVVPHYAATRWTRRFWIGGDPNTAIDMDHNLRYLAATRAFPNFDTSLRVPDAVVARTYAQWQRNAKGLYDAGGWTKYMPTTGGRDDIGPYPGVTVKWLYTGDHRMFEVVSTMADLASAWQMHVREGNPAKWFDAEYTIPAIGRVISVHARPTVWLFDDRDHSKPEDRVTLHGQRILTNTYPKMNGGWVADGAHQPDPYSALYMLTGDFYALEQTQFWAAAQALKYNPGSKGIPASGIFMDQVRGCAWVLRNRVHAAFLSPDTAAEKRYFNNLIDDALAYWEGRLNIHGTAFENTPAWKWGQKNVFESPLHFFSDQPIRGDEGISRALVSTVTALWQHNMLIFEMARAKEKGFPVGASLSWIAVTLTGQFTAGPNYNPFNCENYYTPVRDAEHRFFGTWAETLKGYENQKLMLTFFKPNVSDGYGTYAYAASTMLTLEPGGSQAYAWLRRAGYDPLREKYQQYPKWAFVPRAAENH